MSATVCGCSPRSMLPSCCGSALRKPVQTCRFGDLRLDALEDRCSPSARRTRAPSTSRANSTPPAAIESAASMTSSHSASTASVASLLTRSMRAISKPDLLDFFLRELLRDQRRRLGAEHHAQNRHLLGAGQLLELVRARESDRHCLGLLQPGADDARRDIGLLLDRRVHLVAHRVRRHHDRHERRGA